MGSAIRDNAFTYVNGALNWCDADVASIAQRTGTPSLVYSSARIRSNLETLRACAAATNRSMGIALALKAAGHASIVKSAMAAADAIAPCNLLCEVMSAEENDLALALGFSPDQIVVNGLGWQRSLIEAIVAHPPFAVNVDNVSDCKRLSQCALDHGTVVPIGVRIVPSDAAMFARADEKMGIPEARALSDIAEIKSLPGVRIEGVSFHALHRCTSPGQMGAAAKNIAQQVARLGLADSIKYLDIGGGLDYRVNLCPTDVAMRTFADEISMAFSAFPERVRLIMEPGRFVFGDAAIAATSVATRKQSATKNWLIVDAGTNLLVPIDTASFTVHAAVESADVDSFDVADGICSPTSVIASGCLLPRSTREGDILAIGNAGAYAYALSENWGYAIPPLYLLEPDGSLMLARSNREARSAYMRHWGLEG